MSMKTRYIYTDIYSLSAGEKMDRENKIKIYKIITFQFVPLPDAHVEYKFVGQEAQIAPNHSFRRFNYKIHDLVMLVPLYRFSKKTGTTCYMKSVKIVHALGPNQGGRARTDFSLAWLEAA